MDKYEAQIEISHILQDHIMNFARAYMDLTACRLILKAFDDPMTKTSICHAVNSEFNSVVRKISKCKNKMLQVDYNDTIELLKQLKNDVYNSIINTLKQDTGVLI